MVCPRCIETVRTIFSDLQIGVTAIRLGEVTTTDKIPKDRRTKIEELLDNSGFELLHDQNSQLIAQIKSSIIQQIHYGEEALKVNFSTMLADSLHHDYGQLSRLFSSVEGITIEKFILKQKIEKVKELIFYNELTLSEIAFKMNYSSVAHLSNQFKKETGMTATQFRNQHNPRHKPLDSL